MRYLSLIEVLELHEAIIALQAVHVEFETLKHLNLQQINHGLLSIRPISIQTLFQKQ